MFLRKSAHKLQSSLAHYIFAQRELLFISDHFDWRSLTRFPDAIVRNKKDFSQMIEAIRISVLASHLEIMRQAFYEHIVFIDHDKIPGMKDLGFFLFDLRNAFAHTRGILVPRWDKAPKSKKLFSIDIPSNNHETGTKFNHVSKVSIKFFMKVEPEKIIMTTSSFFDQIALLSYHVLHIVKKQKHATLLKYINGISPARYNNF